MRYSRRRIPLPSAWDGDHGDQHVADERTGKQHHPPEAIERGFEAWIRLGTLHLAEHECGILQCAFEVELQHQRRAILRRADREFSLVIARSLGVTG